MKTLTIRNIPPDLDRALQRERARRSQSLNQTVIDLLRQRLGVGTARSNGLAVLAGRWDDDELREFEDATAPFERVDADLWE
jgi:plasmid stability protein